MTGIRDLVSLKNIGEVHFRDVGGLEEIGEIYQRDATGLKLVWSKIGALAVDVPSGVSGAGASDSIISISTNNCTATPTGGVGPYSYQWEIVSAGGGSWAITNPTANVTKFRANLPSFTLVVGTFKVTVTDSTGQTAVSSNVTATAENFGNFS